MTPTNIGVIKYQPQSVEQKSSKLSLITQDAILGCFFGAVIGLGKELVGKNEAQAELLLLGVTVFGTAIILKNVSKEVTRVRSVKIIAGVTIASLLFGYTFYALPSTPIVATVACGAAGALAKISNRLPQSF